MQFLWIISGCIHLENLFKYFIISWPRYSCCTSRAFSLLHPPCLVFRNPLPSMASLSPLLGTHFATQTLTRLKYQLRQICDLRCFLHLVFLSTETKSHFCPFCGVDGSCPGGFLQHLCTSRLLQLQLLRLVLVPSLGAARGVRIYQWIPHGGEDRAVCSSSCW